MAPATLERPAAAARRPVARARQPVEDRTPPALSLARPRVLLTTEGTYPYVVGGVSSWCDLLVNSLTDFEWQVLPITAAQGRPPIFALPAHAHEVARIELWSEGLPRWQRVPKPERRAGTDLPALLVRGLIAWHGDTETLGEALTWCRRHPAGVRRAFRSRAGWSSFTAALREVLAERIPEAGAPPGVDLVEAALLYQSLYWVARTAAVPTPPSDVLHVTAAGWAAIPALVHKRLHGTPMVLTEHGVYVRESYLAAARGGASPGARFIATRLARGLARAAYDAADVVSPVTDANALWERGLGIDQDKIHVLYNGLAQPERPVAPPRTRTVVSVGRIDPLKDVHTMLRVAVETLRHVPDATFLHYGPVTEGEEDYGRSCEALHAQLGLGDRFRFMGRTADPDGAVRDADVVLMTSISEGLPMAILEAMGQGRPVVATGVGGVPDVVKGCGLVTPPGDVVGLAMAVTTLLRNPALSWTLGRRGHRRLARRFSEQACLHGYHELLMTAAQRTHVAAPAAPSVRIAA
ncbi:MAG: polysaccharide biosynthesis protein PelF [Solirubrobacteraceae bacterium]|jgi:glycosyltransferase involved in cell wall biosynthesis|nr:polysaccharide biosynthesis protein PelF [Solirubrobacteraceae bacterium]